MPEQDTYTKEELEKKSRLLLRRICKEQYGMSSEDCAQTNYEDLVNMILEQQDGGSEKPAKASKSKASARKTSKESAKSGKDALADKRGVKTGKAAPKNKVTAKKPEPENVDDVDDEGVVHADSLAAIETVVEKIDELGQVYNTNNAELVEKIEALTAKVDSQADEIFNLQAEIYKTQGIAVHGFSWLESEGILTEDGAPEGLLTEDKLNALAAECEGNEEGDGEE